LTSAYRLLEGTFPRSEVAYLSSENLVRAPKQVRKERAAAPERPPDLDVMQREAEKIATVIAWWNEAIVKFDLDDKRTQALYGMVEAFGDLARDDPWVSRRNRARSLALYEDLKLTENLGKIQARCLEFISRPPLH